MMKIVINKKDIIRSEFDNYTDFIEVFKDWFFTKRDGDMINFSYNEYEEEIRKEI